MKNQVISVSMDLDSEPFESLVVATFDDGYSHFIVKNDCYMLAIGRETINIC